jgi:hypothetical protein
LRLFIHTQDATRNMFYSLSQKLNITHLIYRSKMKTAKEYFKGESGLAGEFGHSLEVVPLADAQRIVEQVIQDCKSKWIEWKGQSEEQKINFDKLDQERILLKFDDGTVCSFNSDHPFACVTHYLILPE